jgi:hypothetical protein
MKMESAQKRLAYQESVWKVKEIDLVEDKRRLELRIGLGSLRYWKANESIARKRDGYHAERSG